MRFAAPIAPLASCLALAFVPFGCGSSPDFTVVPRHDTYDAPEAPPRTVELITACATRGAERLKDTHYAIIFDVDIKGTGEARAAKVRESMIGDRGMESCMKHALEDMQVPRHIVARFARPRGAGAAVSPQSRASVGNIMVLAGAVELVPILIVALGVTIIVAVTIHVVEEISTSTQDATDEEQERERCKKVKQACILYCSETTLPTPDFGWKFQKCKNDCLERRGCPRES